MVDIFLEKLFAEPPLRLIVIDLDVTDDPPHGNQEGRFWHGYYGNYCYLPLYVTCGRPSARRPSFARPTSTRAAGSVEETARIVGSFAPSRAGRAVRITLRADSGFCREDLMAWCEGEPRRLSSSAWPATCGW